MLYSLFHCPWLATTCTTQFHFTVLYIVRDWGVAESVIHISLLHRMILSSPAQHAVRNSFCCYTLFSKCPNSKAFTREALLHCCPGSRFFCAMEPSMRQKWAEAWAQWLAPGGELVTLMYPVEAEGREGPPWPVPVQLYDDTLRPAG